MRGGEIHRKGNKGKGQTGILAALSPGHAERVLAGVHVRPMLGLQRLPTICPVSAGVSDNQSVNQGETVTL